MTSRTFLQLMLQLMLGFMLTISLVACDSAPLFSVSEINSETGRWYSKAMLAQGETVFQSNCIACHNEKAKGTREWKKRLADGSYPPPPLNGSAHAWHHSMPVLLSTINEGGMPMGGKMPPFKNVLNEGEKLAVVAYFQSFWPDDIYQTWLKQHQ